MKRLYFYLLCCVGFILLCCSVCPVSAQAPKRAKIVFTSARNSNAEIYIMNADGSQQIRLTHHVGEDFDPVWSPTGEHIAFVSERAHEGLYDIYLMDPDGKNIRRAFDDLEYRTAPAWSPDGTQIAYHTYSPIPDWAVYAKPLSGGEVERIAESGMYPGGFPAWSPDGTEVAFTSNNPAEWRIQIINLKTRQQETLLPEIQRDMRYPAWSPDGKKIAFAMRKGGPESSIYILDHHTKKLEEIVKNTSKTPTWSPDGKALLYRKTVGKHNLLFKIDLDSRIETPLARLNPFNSHGKNTGWDWFDPKALPVSPQPQLLTTIWAKVKTTN